MKQGDSLSALSKITITSPSLRSLHILLFFLMAIALISSSVAVADKISFVVRVSSFDCPAHGESSGLSTDLSEWFEVLDQVQDIIQDKEAVYVCHSFGFIAISHAILHLKLRAKAVVAINAPTRFNFLIESFVRRTNLHRDSVPYLVKNLEARLRDIREITDVRSDQLSRKLRLLYVADQSDKEVPFSEHTAAASLLQEKFVVMHGFGHNRILATPGLYEILDNFVRVSCGMTRARLASTIFASFRR